MKYYSKSPPLEAKFKEKICDFVVIEHIKNLKISKTNKYEHTLYKLVKINADTYSVLKKIKELLRISYLRIGIAGIKDKKGVTSQYITIWRCEEDILKTSYFTLYKIGYSRTKIKPNNIDKNEFIITLREIKNINSFYSICEELNGIFPNYYGIQRFGNRFINHVIGRLLLEGKLKDAIQVMLCHIEDWEDEEIKEGRKLCSEGKYREALKIFPKYMKLERMLCDMLIKKESPENIIRKIPIQFVSIFPKAYQSFLFNRLVEKTMTPKRGVLFGYKVKIPKDVYEEANEILKEENINLKFFKSKYPKLSCPGDYRRTMAKYEDFNYKLFENNLILNFKLKKGVYATSLIREFLKDDKKVWDRIFDNYEKYIIKRDF
jgi:tRNA pseudouridine13 synthase